MEYEIYFEGDLDMARGKKFNVFMEHVTIDYPTLMKYRNILDEYIKNTICGM